MLFELLGTALISVFKAFTSLCTCMKKPTNTYDILCNEKNLGHCSGNLNYQIRLSLNKSVVFHEMPSLRLSGYDTVIPGEYIILKNTGTSCKLLVITWEQSYFSSITVSIILDEKTPIEFALNIFGGFLQGRFKFHDLHFHWKPTDRCKFGTEHTIGDKRTHLEMHLAHYNVKYSTYAEALQNRDGVAILTFLFKKSKTIQISSLYPVVRKLHKVLREDQETTFNKGFAFESLIPIPKCKYFTYYRSSVGRSATEVVTWIVFQQILKVTPSDVSV